MTDSPNVSVIILSHNGEKVLENCLRSVIETDYSPLEIILVDNFSKDSTPQIASRYKEKIKIIRTKENFSFAKANNLGIKCSTGKILVLLNDDTIVTKEWIRSLVEVFEKDKKIGIVGCKILFPDSDIIQHFGGYIMPNGITMHYGYGENDGKNYSEIKAVEYVTGAAFAFRRSLVDTLGNLPEAYKPIYFEEVEYCFRAKKQGFSVVVAPDAKVYHYESQKTIAKSFGFYYKYHKNRIRFVLRNFNYCKIITAFLSELPWLLKNFSIKQLTSLAFAYSNIFFLPVIFTRHHKQIFIENSEDSRNEQTFF
ncbi:glycosyltransferase family 2 protein [bacterium]|nr:glycosyltransferase family 2 protein [bacterium]